MLIDYNNPIGMDREKFEEYTMNKIVEKELEKLTPDQKNDFYQTAKILMGIVFGIGVLILLYKIYKILWMIYLK